MNEEERAFVESVASEFRGFRETHGFKTNEIADSLGVRRRALRSVAAGLNESYPRIASTAAYAVLFYHCDVSSADPRKIPGESQGLIRRWTNAQYQRWRQKQPTPHFISEFQYLEALLIEVSQQLWEVITGDPLVREAFADNSKAELRDLQRVLRILLLTRQERERELEVMPLEGGAE